MVKILLKKSKKGRLALLSVSGKNLAENICDAKTIWVIWELISSNNQEMSESKFQQIHVKSLSNRLLTVIKINKYTMSYKTDQKSS